MENKNWEKVGPSWKDIAKAVGYSLVQALARPHILSPVSNHFQKEPEPDMGDDLFRRRYQTDLAAWEMHRARAVVSSHDPLTEAVINDTEVQGGEVA